MRHFYFPLALFVLCRSAFLTPAAQLAVGDLVPGITAFDLHGQVFNSTNGFQFLLIATEMGCAKAANQKLAAQAAGFLEQNSTNVINGPCCNFMP